MTVQREALVRLGKALAAEEYGFVTVSPETHRRVDARARTRGDARARSLRDVFGWSRPFAPGALPPVIHELADRAGVLVEEGDDLRSTVRFSTLRGHLFVHSAFPTTASRAVFFGPDTYRFCDLIATELADAEPFARAVDVGCGTGAGGLVARPRVRELLFSDVNPDALAYAEVNAALAGAREDVSFVESDVLGSVEGSLDLVLANPPYMADPAARAYRDGGGALGEELALRIVREALERLSPGGKLIVYTGSAIVDGRDTFYEASRPLCAEARASFRYREIDPDVFGDEIEHNDAYANVERIAAVALVATMP